MKAIQDLYRHGWSLALLAMLFFAASFPLTASAQNTVKGSLTVNGKKTEFLHAYAVARPKGEKDMIKTTLILADKPLPAEAVTDKMERSTAQDRGIKMLVLGFTDGKDLASFTTNVDPRLSNRISSAHKATLDTFSDEAIKGRVFTEAEQQIRTAPGTYSFDVQFNVAMTVPKAPDAAGAKAWDTPQGKVLAEFLRAARAGDKAALKRVLTAESFKELEGKDAAENLKMIKMMSPDPKKV
ncbi:MAG: hypothetical protein EOO54_24290, partial [Haliea sp.]